ncbi:hypothetical protein ACFQZS_17195 [Mucilaginibacter calamicampi]|uniref:Uncharacterized protein n=1 Tax=Mucilaginibacter calamicampi TaxID=1302352 RepID=A0ABW2Z326_9SPHI
MGSRYCIDTLYRIKGGFVPEKIFVFQTESMGLEVLKKAVDFYFTTLLETELYVKEVPQDSALFEQESLRLFGLSEEEAISGSVNVAHRCWTK